MHIHYINVDYERVIMCYWNIRLLKVNASNTRATIFIVECKKILCIRKLIFLKNWSNEIPDAFFCIREVFDCYGRKNKANVFVLFMLNKWNFSTELFLRTFKSKSNVLGGQKLCWEINFNMWKHRSNLIKYGPNLFNICPLVVFLLHKLMLILDFTRWFW